MTKKYKEIDFTPSITEFDRKYLRARKRCMSTTEKIVLAALIAATVVALLHAFVEVHLDDVLRATQEQPIHQNDYYCNLWRQGTPVANASDAQVDALCKKWL